MKKYNPHYKLHLKWKKKGRLINNVMPDETKAQQEFKRQMVLMIAIKEYQSTCQHTLKQQGNVITCIECGAIWIK